MSPAKERVRLENIIIIITIIIIIMFLLLDSCEGVCPSALSSFAGVIHQISTTETLQFGRPQGRKN